MTAYIVALLLVMTQAGPVVVTLKLPIADMAACEAWIAHPEQVGSTNVADARFGCEPIKKPETPT